MIEVFVFANGNSNIGMGHVRRSLMIVKVLLSKGIQSTYLSFNNDPVAIAEIEQETSIIPIVPQRNKFLDVRIYSDLILDLVKEGHTPLLYVDTDLKEFYSKDFQQGIIENGIKLMYATLFNNVHYYAHIILNQNILGLYQTYSTEKYTKRLLGPNYFLWPEKARLITAKTEINGSKPLRLFVNFGNADPNDLTSRIVEVVQYLDCFECVTVVVGELYSHYDSLLESVSNGNSNIQLYRNPPDIYDLMKECNLGVSSLGMTFWELTYMNIPSLILSGSERERLVCEFMDQKKYARKLGDYANINWQLDWRLKLGAFIEKKDFCRLKTNELKEMININGSYDVVKEMMSLG